MNIDREKLIELMKEAGLINEHGYAVLTINHTFYDESLTKLADLVSAHAIALQNEVRYMQPSEALNERNKLGYAVADVIGKLDEIIDVADEVEVNDFLHKAIPIDLWHELQEALENMPARAESFTSMQENISEKCTSEPVAEVINKPWPQGICPKPESGRWYTIHCLDGEMLPHGTKLFTHDRVKGVSDEMVEFEKAMQEKFGWNNTSDIIENGHKYSEMVFQHVYYALAGWQARSQLSTNTDGWVIWHGSYTSPVETNQLVDIKRRNGDILKSVNSSDYNWSHTFLATQHHIVAYRKAISQDKGESV